MKELFLNYYSLLIFTLIIGGLLGHFVLKPILGFLVKYIQKRNYNYFALLLKSLKNIAFIITIGLLLNLLELLPITTNKPDWFHKIVISVNVFTVTYIITEFVIFIYDRYTKAKLTKTTSLYHILIRILCYITGFIVYSNLIGLEIAPILTALGVGGLAVALALQDTLGNLFSGMHILAAKQLQPGDYIKLDSGEEGYVLDINWRNTMIKTLLENVVIIPNSKISSTITTNFFTLQKNHFFQIIVGVHYDSDLEQVEQVTLEIARQVLSEFPPLPKLFEPSVRYFEFADSSINMKVWLATDVYENQFKIRHIFIQRLQKRFKEEGIVIPFPIRTLEISSSSLKHLK